MGDKRTRITFIHPPDPPGPGAGDAGTLFPPLWAYTLASHVDSNDIELELLDARLQDPACVREWDLFLYSGMTRDHRALIDIRSHIARRFPGSLHLIGGPICRRASQTGSLELLSDFDFVFIGDGEETLPDFVARWRSGEALARTIETKEDFRLSSARPMHRDLIKRTIHRYPRASVEISRGCQFFCEFCSNWSTLHPNAIVVKPTPLLISEIDFLTSLGVGEIQLVCDNLIADPRGAEELCESITEWRRSRRAPFLRCFGISLDLARHPGLMNKMRSAGLDNACQIQSHCLKYGHSGLSRLESLRVRANALAT